MNTDIYKIDNDGEISFFATYCLPKEQALRSAVLKYLMKRGDSWNYDKIAVPLIKRKDDLYFPFNENSVLFTRDSV